VTCGRTLGRGGAGVWRTTRRGLTRSCTCFFPLSECGCFVCLVGVFLPFLFLLIWGPLATKPPPPPSLACPSLCPLGYARPATGPHPGRPFLSRAEATVPRAGTHSGWQTRARAGSGACQCGRTRR